MGATCTWETRPGPRDTPVVSVEGGHMPFPNVTGLIAGILAIVGGIVVMVWPRILAYIIGVYLIIVGIFAVIAALR